MASKKKLLQAAAGSAGGAGLDVDEVFSTYLYDGTGSAQTITNNIDLAGEGGLVWTKTRSSNQYGHRLIDEGSNVILSSDVTNGALNGSLSVTQYYLAGQSNGFNLVGSQFNVSGQDYVSWTFRKAPKFFDVVTYTGTGSAQNISHNLGSVPGMIIVKRTSNSEDWLVYHRSTGNQAGTGLNETAATYTGVSAYWNSTTPTDSVFTVGTHDRVNTSGETYVAYLFAHNNSDGEFGPDADQDIIKCGSFTKTDTGGTNFIEVNLGFEVQWLLTKTTSESGNWEIWDVQRGLSYNGNQLLNANLTSAESNYPTVFRPTPNGFEYNDNNAASYIYMAIRRGPLAEPESATDVFAMDSNGLSANSEGVYFTSNFPVDFTINKERTHTSDPWVAMSRLQGNGNYLDTSSTAAEVSGISNGTFDHMTGWMQSGSAMMSWMWKRAPSFFDVVAYSGTGSARTISHNLGAVPEMIWVKRRDNTASWVVYHKGLNGGTTPEDYVIELNNSSGEYNNTNWNDTAPTSSVFSVGTANSVNNSSGTYIAYLFATVAGVSKVGSFVADGNAQNIDCGFSSGARFVLIKKSSGTFDWRVWDSTRGIVAGDDPYLFLNSTAAEATNGDWIDPYSSGFSITSAFSNGTYIFYAIA